MDFVSVHLLSIFLFEPSWINSVPLYAHQDLVSFICPRKSSIYLFIFKLFVCLSVSIVCPSVISLCINPPSCLSLCLSLDCHLSIYRTVCWSVCLSVGLSFSLPVFLLALQTGLKQGPLLLCANVGLFIISVYPPASLSFFTCSTRTAICLSVCLFVNCYLKLPLNGLYVYLSLHHKLSQSVLEKWTNISKFCTSCFFASGHVQILRTKQHFLH